MATGRSKQPEEKKEEIVEQKAAPISIPEGFEEFAEDVGLGLENISTSDIRIPVYKIVQSNSKQAREKDVNIGDLYDTTNGVPYEKLRVLLLSMKKVRTMFPEKYSADSRPLCRSFDGKTGQGDPGGNCERCPMAQFKKDEEGNLSVRCKEGFSWLAINLENKDIFKIIPKSAGLKPTKDFLTKYALGSFQNNKISKYPLFCYIVEITTVEEESNKGVFNNYRYEIVDYATKEQALWARDVLEDFREVFEREVEEDAVTVSVDDDDETIVGGEETGSTEPKKAF